MKKLTLKLATLLMCGAFVFSSCIGSFALHQKVLNWNQGIGDKWVNEVVFLALNIIPVYGICYLADAVVINSIEFWSGDNPVASIGDVRQVKGENGNYLVTTLENGYSITKEGEDVSVDEMHEFIVKSLARHKVPKYIRFVDAFPMNAAGKILKYKMREDAARELGLDM